MHGPLSVQLSAGSLSWQVHVSLDEDEVCGYPAHVVIRFGELELLPTALISCLFHSRAPGRG